MYNLSQQCHFPIPQRKTKNKQHRNDSGTTAPDQEIREEKGETLW